MVWMVWVDLVGSIDSVRQHGRMTNAAMYVRMTYVRMRLFVEEGGGRTILYPIHTSYVHMYTHRVHIHGDGGLDAFLTIIVEAESFARVKLGLKLRRTWRLEIP